MLMLKLTPDGAVERYPYPLGDLLADHPHTSFALPLNPADLADFGVFPVAEAKAPWAPIEQTVIEADPALIDGAWVQQWTTRPATPDELEARMQAAERSITAAIQARLDAFARTRGYDGIASLASYAGDPDPQFAAEGGYGRSVRSATWRKAWQIMADVQAGRRALPSGIGDIEAELPALAWPAA